MPLLRLLLFSAITVMTSSAHASDDTLKEIEGYLNGLTTVTAKFSQVAPDGSEARGLFYMQRPGKMRWEYEPPTPILMVSNGDTLTYYDKELAQTTYIPLQDTLAAFLVRKHIKLSGDIIVDEVKKDSDRIFVTLHQSGKADEGSLTLEFITTPLELQSLSITDAVMQKTKVSFSGSEFGKSIPQNFFLMPEITLRNKR